MSKPWHDEARALYAQGIGVVEIGRRLGHTRNTVRDVLDKGHGRETQKDKSKDSGWMYLLRSDLPKPKRATPRIVPKEEKMAACVEFARGKITRAELMRRITPTELRTDP